MADSSTPAKAELRELDASGNEANRSKWVTVQFNPESLKVAFANQVTPQSGNGTAAQDGTNSRQFTGSGTTKLTLSIWFDVTAGHKPPGTGEIDDVRRLTQGVAYFITPNPAQGAPPRPPLVRFLWGSFRFDGMMDSLEENLEFFSPEGKPLRASMNLSLSQQSIELFHFNETSGKGPGARPMTQAPAGTNLPDLAGAAGQANNWQKIAAANGIENPRFLDTGRLIDLNVIRK